MRKIFLNSILLLCALIVGSGSLWATNPSVELTVTNLELTGSYSSSATKTIGGVTFCHTDLMKSTDYIQVKASSGVIYNTTPFPENIVSVAITHNSTARSTTIWGSSNGTDWTQVQTGSGSITANFSGRNYTYFKITRGSNAAYWSSVVITYEETVTKHTLSSSVAPVGVGSVTLGSTSVGESKTTTIEASATNENYRFKNWTFSGTGASVANTLSASTTFTMGTTDATVTANFEEIPSHTLSSAVSPVGAGTVTLGSSSVKEGSTTTATAAAAANFKFTGWSISGTGASLSSTSTNPTTVTMGTADATVTAIFEAVTTYAITYSVNGKTTTVNVEENASVDLSAPTSGIPLGYVFKGWRTSALDKTNTDPNDYVTSATSTANITYYAVMAVMTASAPDSYEKLASNSFEVNAKYVIGALQGGNGGDGTTVMYFNNYSAVGEDLSWGGCTSTPSTNSPIQFSLSGTAAALIAKDGSGNYLAASSAEKKFAMSASSTTVYLNSDGAIKTASDGNLLRYNHNEGNGGLRWYNGTTGKQAYFYKVIDNCTYANFRTSVPTITISESCTDGTGSYFATYSNGSAFVVPDDIIVYEIVVDNSQIVLFDYTDGDIVPANTGVLVESIEPGIHAIELSAEEGTSVLDGSGYENALKPSGNAGINAAGMATAAPGCTYYKLAFSDSNMTPSTLGFYYGAGSGAGFDLDANKAYLAVASGDLAPSRFLLNEEESGATNIEAVDATDEAVKFIQNGKLYIKKNGVVYDLLGAIVRK